MIAKLLIPGFISGIVAGILLTIVQQFNVVPLILEAETYEVQSSQHSHAVTENEKNNVAADHHNSNSGQAEWAPDDGNERTLFTLMTNILLGIGFSLLMITLMTATNHSGWQSGLLWGLAGFCVFYLAPSIGLPPELPGSVSAALEHRQLWWSATVVATAIGLGLLFLNPATTFKVLGVLFLIAPHFFSNSVSLKEAHLVPEGLITSFIISTTVANIFFWSIIGFLNGVLKSRYFQATPMHKTLS